MRLLYIVLFVLKFNRVCLILLLACIALYIPRAIVVQTVFAYKLNSFLIVFYFYKVYYRLMRLLI